MKIIENNKLKVYAIKYVATTYNYNCIPSITMSIFPIIYAKYEDAEKMLEVYKTNNIDSDFIKTTFHIVEMKMVNDLKIIR